MSLEASRQLLEELECLEAAATQRFRKNPALSAAAAIAEPDTTLQSRAKRPHKQTLSQQHELKYFAAQYALNAQRLSGLLASDALREDIARLRDPQMKFDGLLADLEGLAQKVPEQPEPARSMLENYLLYSSAPSVPAGSEALKVKRKYFLSAATEFVSAHLASAFNEAEMYGKYLDLSLFHEMCKVATQSDISYLDFLRQLGQFSTARNPEYKRYLEALLAYLEKFAANAFPLQEVSYCSIKIEEPKDGIFCKACDKHFAKQSVFDAHLSGKKHKKNAQKADGEKDAPPTNSLGSQILTLEAKIKLVLQVLSPVVDATIRDHERRSRLSEREMAMEISALEGNESDETYIESENGPEHSDDDDLEDAYSKDLPLDADGVPIPLWLYKLQGLHRSYTCEICGSATYKGRQQYTKHFGQPKHVHGLVCLGISESDTPLFTNIAAIKEAQDLWAKISKNKRHVHEKEESAVEVEDDEGNVMSQKDYNELRRQGLI